MSRGKNTSQFTLTTGPTFPEPMWSIRQPTLLSLCPSLSRPMESHRVCPTLTQCKVTVFFKYRTTRVVWVSMDQLLSLFVDGLIIWSPLEFHKSHQYYSWTSPIDMKVKCRLFHHWIKENSCNYSRKAWKDVYHSGQWVFKWWTMRDFFTFA